MEFDKRSPIYEQLKRYYKEAIVSGVYKMGEKLPSRREIAQEFKINPNTVQRALKELEEEEIIMSGSNVLSTVTTDEAVLNRLKNDMLNEAMALFYEMVKPLGLDSAQIMDNLDDYIKERGEINA